MIKLKSLNKKLRRLETSLQKDAKKLAKLKRKVEVAIKAEPKQAKAKSPIRVEKASKPSPPVAKKKRRLTAAGREKLSALMKARWAAKRAGTAPAGGPQPTES